MVQQQRNSIGAILLIALGVIFLVGQAFSINIWSIMGFSWPVFVLIPGIIFLALAFAGDRKMAGFAVPGAIITGTGAILWYQNWSDNWQSWAYIWTLYPVFLGLALMFIARRKANERQFHTGRNFVNFGLIAFLVGAAFFELFIFHSNGALTRWLLPLGLIGAGGYLYLTGHVPVLVIGGKEKRKTDEPIFTGARNIGTRTNGHLSASDDLQRRIDEAIAEDDPVEPKA